MLRSFAPLVGCGLMMLVCMLVMGAASNRNRSTDKSTPASTDEISALRGEVARLRQLDEDRRATPQEPAP